MRLLLTIGLPILYTAAGLVAARLVAGHLAFSWRDQQTERYRSLYNERPDRPPAGDQWFGAWCVGLLVGVVWPAALIASHISISRFAVGAEASDIRRRREERIAELERELNV